MLREQLRKENNTDNVLLALLLRLKEHTLDKKTKQNGPCPLRMQ
jgi:hypothetical protein